MTDRLLSAISLCRKAGKLICGFDIAAAAARDGSAKLMLVTSDISDRSRRGITAACQEENVPVLEIARTMDEVAQTAGKPYGILAICDTGFAGMIKKALMEENGGKQSG